MQLYNKINKHLKTKPYLLIFKKHTKKELSVAYFNVISDFRKNIDIICDTSHKDLKEDIDTLIGEKEQLFDGMVKKSTTSAELTYRKAA